MKPNKNHRAPVAAVLTAGLGLTAPFAMAGPMPDAGMAVDPPAPDDSTWCDSLWDYATLYNDPDAAFLQKLTFTGRFQADYALVDGEGAGGANAEFDDWNVRRFRMGFKAKILNDFTLHAEGNFNPQETTPFYRNITDAYLAWSRDDSFKIKVGKQAAEFTLDGHTSSKKLLTIDRNAVSQNLWFSNQYMPGVSVSGDVDNFNYFLGFFSGGSASPEFGDFDGSYFGLLTLGYDFADSLGIDKAHLEGDYVYQDPDPLNTFTKTKLEHIVSLGLTLEEGPWGFATGATFASAAGGTIGGSDSWGASLMPYYSINENWQVVGRYSYVKSDDPNGVGLSRYERFATGGKGDEYQEYYVGLNWYICDHKLKIQTGVQYTDLDDSANDGGAFDGLSWTTAFRFYW